MPSKAFWLGLILGGMIFGFIFWGINYSLGSGDEALKMALILPAYLFAGIFIVLLIGSFNLRYQIRR